MEGGERSSAFGFLKQRLGLELDCYWVTDLETFTNPQKS